MHPYRAAAEREAPERDSGCRLAKGDRVRVVAAEADSDPIVRAHGCEAGIVDHVLPGTGAVFVTLASGRYVLFLREWLIAVDS